MRPRRAPERGREESSATPRAPGGRRAPPRGSSPDRPRGRRRPHRPAAARIAAPASPTPAPSPSRRRPSRPRSPRRSGRSGPPRGTRRGPRPSPPCRRARACARARRSPAARRRSCARSRTPARSPVSSGAPQCGQRSTRPTLPACRAAPGSERRLARAHGSARQRGRNVTSTGVAPGALARSTSLLRRLHHARAHPHADRRRARVLQLARNQAGVALLLARDPHGQPHRGGRADRHPRAQAAPAQRRSPRARAGADR